MPDASLAVLGAIGGAVITAASSLTIFLVRRRTMLYNGHLRRAFEKHLSHYERVFVSARTAQDSLRNYMVISNKVTDRSDPFLFQLLAIAADSAHQYCVAVSWNHNPGMVYLELKLEDRCLFARDLLLKWLSVQRVRTGNVASIRKKDGTLTIPIPKVRSLKAGGYHELRLEKRRIVLPDSNDARRFSEIDHALTSVIVELKAVMAY